MDRASSARRRRLVWLVGVLAGLAGGALCALMAASVADRLLRRRGS